MYLERSQNKLSCFIWFYISAMRFLLPFIWSERLKNGHLICTMRFCKKQMHFLCFTQRAKSSDVKNVSSINRDGILINNTFLKNKNHTKSGKNMWKYVNIHTWYISTLFCYDYSTLNKCTISCYINLGNTNYL